MEAYLVTSIRLISEFFYCILLTRKISNSIEKSNCRNKTIFTQFMQHYTKERKFAHVLLADNQIAKLQPHGDSRKAIFQVEI